MPPKSSTTTSSSSRKAAATSDARAAKASDAPRGAGKKAAASAAADHDRRRTIRLTSEDAKASYAELDLAVSVPHVQRSIGSTLSVMEGTLHPPRVDRAAAVVAAAAIDAVAEECLAEARSQVPNGETAVDKPDILAAIRKPAGHGVLALLNPGVERHARSLGLGFAFLPLGGKRADKTAIAPVELEPVERKPGFVEFDFEHFDGLVDYESEDELRSNEKKERIRLFTESRAKRPAKRGRPASAKKSRSSSTKAKEGKRSISTSKKSVKASKKGNDEDSESDSSDSESSPRRQAAPAAKKARTEAAKPAGEAPAAIKGVAKIPSAAAAPTKGRGRGKKQ